MPSPHPMTVEQAQREVRTVFLHGSVGQLVAGSIWLVAAALGTWAGSRPGILALVLGGPLILPLTQLYLRLSGRPWALRPENPFAGLARQIAFTVPLTLPVVGAAALHNVGWFFPACLVTVGAHYLPFVFLYGMWQFAPLGAAMIAGGVALAFVLPDSFPAGGWLGAGLLLLAGAWLAASRAAERTEA